jgi:hypothetical protein
MASGWRAGCARGVEAYVIHPASVAVSREHRRAKTDRLDTELLMRAFVGWLGGEDPVVCRSRERSCCGPSGLDPSGRTHLLTLLRAAVIGH